MSTISQIVLTKSWENEGYLGTISINGNQYQLNEKMCNEILESIFVTNAYKDVQKIDNFCNTTITNS